MNECIDKVLRTEARVPLSTYRIQMHAGFSFAQAQSILAYLARLGVGDFYSSPIFEARPGSMHGYDVTRHDRLNPELGGDESFARFSAELKRLGLGLLLDIVPNHMGIGNDSIWWQDVLENGHASPYAEYFDIDWNPLKTDMKDRLLLPILGNQYGIELEDKRIQTVVENGSPLIRYYDHTLPLSPRSLPILFLEQDDAAYGVPRSFRDLLDRLKQIPPHETSDADLRGQRQKQLRELLPRIREILRSAEMQPAVERTIESINGIAGEPRSFDRLHKLLDAQPYRLASWRTSAEEVNYRRFFDVNDLAGLRMENPEAFAATHRLIRALLARQDITGVRIDHCDGMLNPRQYLIRLQLLYLASRCSGETPQGETAANGIERGILDPVRGYDWSKSQGPLYAVVEKILEPREHLPMEWPVHGTTGYDFIYLANEIFIQSENEKHFDALYAQLLGRPSDPDTVVYRARLQVMQTSLASEVYALTNLLSRIAAANRYARDFTDNILETVLRETIACFPVYRTYIDDRGEYGERDVAFIRFAITRAKRLNPDVDASAFDFLRDTLLLKSGPAAGRQMPDPRILYFALKFQQLTGPVAAKGVEDTTFYVYNRFISSNEVGGAAKSFGISLETFHQNNQDRLQYSPGTMNTTSTHDTKRSEDVRNRLNVLSEMPRAWSSFVYRWRHMNERYKSTLEDGRVAPDPNEEYLLYQTIVGAWPWQMETEEESESFAERIKQYASKALSEAKVNLSWINPDPAYVEAVHSFIAAILPGGPRRGKGPFVRSVQQLLPRLRLFGAVNSLAAVVLKAASPGVPDFYQGTELWHLALVDPDNRRSVDFDLRSKYLDEMIARAAAEGPGAVCREVLSTLADGRAKLWTIHRSLQLRRRAEATFRRGEYIPLNVTAPGGVGSKAESAFEQKVIAFMRRDPASGSSVIAAVPRFSSSLMQGKAELPLGKVWAGSRLTLPRSAASRYMNVLTGESCRQQEDGSMTLSDVFASFPVALLLSEE